MSKTDERATWDRITDLTREVRDANRRGDTGRALDRAKEIRKLAREVRNGRPGRDADVTRGSPMPPDTRK